MESHGSWAVVKWGHKLSNNKAKTIHDDKTLIFTTWRLGFLTTKIMKILGYILNFKPCVKLGVVPLINGSELPGHEPNFPLSQDLSKNTMSVQLTGLSARWKSPKNKTIINDNGLITTTQMSTPTNS